MDERRPHPLAAELALRACGAATNRDTLGYERDVVSSATMLRALTLLLKVELSLVPHQMVVQLAATAQAEASGVTSKKCEDLDEQALAATVAAKGWCGGGHRARCPSRGSEPCPGDVYHRFVAQV